MCRRAEGHRGVGCVARVRRSSKWVLSCERLIDEGLDSHPNDSQLQLINRLSDGEPKRRLNGTARNGETMGQTLDL